MTRGTRIILLLAACAWSVLVVGVARAQDSIRVRESVERASPGPITPDRIWCSTEGALAIAFDYNAAPRPLAHVGMAQELAAWLVLLDKWMETFVVIARARAVWSVQELAGALTFTSRPFLPAALIYMPPDNWARVAAALAAAVGDGALAGGAQSEQHWQEK